MFDSHPNPSRLALFSTPHTPPIGPFCAATVATTPRQTPPRAWLPGLLSCLLPCVLAACASTATPPADPVASDWAAPPSTVLTLPQTWRQPDTALTATAARTSADVPAASTDRTTWWTRFNDPTLTRLIEQAQATHTDVRSAQAALRQARATRDATAAARLP